MSLKSKIAYSPFLPWKLLLKPEWFINLQLSPGVPWNNHRSLLPFVSSIFCFRIMYEPKRAGFWTRSIFKIWLEQVCWNWFWTWAYCRESFTGSSSTRCTVISKPCESFGCGIQWVGSCRTPCRRKMVMVRVRLTQMLLAEFNTNSVLALSSERKGRNA